MDSAQPCCLYRRISNTETMCYGRFAAMHTRFDLILWGANISSAELGQIVDECCATVKAIEKMANRFDAGSEVALLNRGVCSQVSEELSRLLSICETGRALTLGYFDISAGDEAYDLSGVAKGYALERLRPIVNARAGLNLLVSAGNSSVMAIGNRPGFDCWPVALEADASKMFELRNECLSTSGHICGMKPHIVNPMTGELVNRCGLVSVITSDAVWGEILSTALMAAPRTDVEPVLRNIPHREVTFFDL